MKRTKKSHPFREGDKLELINNDSMAAPIGARCVVQTATPTIVGGRVCVFVEWDREVTNQCAGAYYADQFKLADPLPPNPLPIPKPKRHRKWRIGQDVRYKDGTVGIVINACKAFPKTPNTFKVVWLNDGHISTESSNNPGGITAIGGVVYTVSKETKRPAPNSPRADGTIVLTHTGELALTLSIAVSNKMLLVADVSTTTHCGVVMLTGPKTGRCVVVATKSLRIPQAVTANAFMPDDTHSGTE